VEGMTKERDCSVGRKKRRLHEERLQDKKSKEGKVTFIMGVTKGGSSKGKIFIFIIWCD
jgi:hypothetical protein